MGRSAVLDVGEGRLARESAGGLSHFRIGAADDGHLEHTAGRGSDRDLQLDPPALDLQGRPLGQPIGLNAGGDPVGADHSGPVLHLAVTVFHIGQQDGEGRIGLGLASEETTLLAAADLEGANIHSLTSGLTGRGLLVDGDAAGHGVVQLNAIAGHVQTIPADCRGIGRSERLLAGVSEHAGKGNARDHGRSEGLLADDRGMSAMGTVEGHATGVDVAAGPTRRHAAQVGVEEHVGVGRTRDADGQTFHGSVLGRERGTDAGALEGKILLEQGFINLLGGGQREDGQRERGCHPQ